MLTCQFWTISLKQPCDKAAHAYQQIALNVTESLASEFVIIFRAYRSILHLPLCCSCWQTQKRQKEVQLWEFNMTLSDWYRFSFALCIIAHAEEILQPLQDVCLQTQASIWKESGKPEGKLEGSQCPTGTPMQLAESQPQHSCSLLFL